MYGNPGRGRAGGSSIRAPFTRVESVENLYLHKSVFLVRLTCHSEGFFRHSESNDGRPEVVKLCWGAPIIADFGFVGAFQGVVWAKILGQSDDIILK